MSKLAFQLACTGALLQSEKDGCVQHVCAVITVVDGCPAITGYQVSDWFDTSTIRSFSCGREL
jgi:hypothetical protein